MKKDNWFNDYRPREWLILIGFALFFYGTLNLPLFNQIISGLGLLFISWGFIFPIKLKKKKKNGLAKRK